MRLGVSWRSSQCSVVDKVARQECGPSRISGLLVKFDFFFFFQTKTKQNRLWQIWLAALAFVTCDLLISWSRDHIK